jgi:hypothetical protein
LEHDPEKWIPVFGKDHAQTKSWSGMTIRRKVITLLRTMTRGYIRSAPTGAIHWAAAICRRPRAHADARRTDANRAWPHAQHDAGPHDAVSRIINILAVNHGIGRLRTHGNSDKCCQRNNGAGPPEEPRHGCLPFLASVRLIK